MISNQAKPPSQSRSQRLEALARANRVRHDRAAIKDDLRHGKSRIAELLVDPPACLLTASLAEILLAVPGLGKVGVRRLLNSCRISPSKRIGGLSERQRGEILRAFEGSGRVRAFRSSPQPAAPGEESGLGPVSSGGTAG